MALIPVNDLSRWEPEDFKEVTRCMTEVAKSGQFMRGKHTSNLENQLGTTLGGMNAVCVGNGTDALVLSLLSLGIQPGDKVATMSNAGGYGTGAILRIGAIPVLVDVDLTTAQMSVPQLSEKLDNDPRIKATIVTHLYGLMADMNPLKDAITRHGSLLVEDCAQAIGASQMGIPAGAWGDASTFSFYPTKNLACLGDGGAVAFRSAQNADICRRLAQYGWSERYVISHRNGFNSRLDEIQAAILVSRMRNLPRNNKIRASIVARYAEAVSSKRRMICSDSDDFVAHLAVLVTPNQTADIEVIKQAGVDSGIHYPILDHHQPAWHEHFLGEPLPNSERLAKSIITLPCFPLMTEDEISRVCEILKSL